MNLDNEALLRKLQSNPIVSTKAMIEDLFRILPNIPHTLSMANWTKETHSLLMQASALVSELIAEKILVIPKYNQVEIVGDVSSDCSSAYRFLKSVLDACTELAMLESYEGQRARFKIALGGMFSYEFSDGDLTRAQQLLSELRDHIVGMKEIEEGHRSRLLARLEKLQAELHKKMPDMDRFWGLLGDAGVAFGKFGTDAKPLVDRIRELTGIVWRTQSRKEELPTDSPPPRIEYDDPTDV